MKKTVLLRAPVLTQSGYGVHSRQIARWLLSKDINLKVQAVPWGDTPWLLDRTGQGGLIGSLMDRATSPEKCGQCDVTVQLQLPNEWDVQLGSVNVGVTAGVETDRCNPVWIEACNRMSRVVVPSKHTATCLRSTGTVNVPIHVIPESYTEAVAVDQAMKLPDFPAPFNFLIFGQMTGENPHSDRKNTFFALKWLLEEFANDANVGIVLKTNYGRNTLMDRNRVLGMVRGIVNEVRGERQEPKVQLLHGGMTDEEVAGLYRHPQVKALVAPTRGEGFGLPILEAAASGLPVIATSWSGHLDYLSHGRYIELAYDMEDVHPTRIDGAIFVKGSRWAAPTEQDFKRKVRKFYRSNDTPRRWATELRPKIVELFSQKAIESAYDSALGDMLA